MMNNGFADALNNLNTVMDVNKQVELDVLEEAARFFASKLKQAIPLGPGDTHLKDQLEIVVKNDHVQLRFGEKGWYWYLAEKGHKKQNGGRVKGRHFFKKTMTQYGDKTAEIMAERILQHMGG